MTEQDHENYAINLFAESFPGEVPSQEQREGERLRAFLVSQLLDYRSKPIKPVFEED